MWAKLDDGFHDHPKTQAVTCGATGLLCRALTWSMRHLTGGWVPDTQIKSLAGLSSQESDELVAELVRVRAFDPMEKDEAHGWMIHGIHDYNPTPAEVRKQRKVREEAARKAGNASATKRQRRRCGDVAASLPSVSTSGATDFNPVPSPPVPSSVPSERVEDKASPTLGPYLDAYLEEVNARRVECGEPTIVLADIAEAKDTAAIGRYLKRKGWPAVEAWRARVKEWTADAWTAGNGLLRLRDFQGWHQRRTLRCVPKGDGLWD